MKFFSDTEYLMLYSARFKGFFVYGYAIFHNYLLAKRLCPRCQYTPVVSVAAYHYTVF